MSTSLLHAISEGRIHQTRLLLDIGTNPNCTDKSGKTPLMLACLLKKDQISHRIARMVLGKGADVTLLDKDGRSALSYASQNGQEKLVPLLLDDLDYDINLPDKDGNTPLIYAAMSGNPVVLREVLHVVVKFGLDVDLRNKKGFSAYLMAAKLGHFLCAQILKLEGKASDCICDSEFFLSDKEWAKKNRKELLKLNVQNSDRFRNRSYSRMVLVERPKTCPAMANYSTRSRLPTTSIQNIEKMTRSVSRFTSRSEPTINFEVNARFSSDIEQADSRATSASSHNIIRSNVTEITRSAVTIPSGIRTQTPDLHEIFKHYFNGHYDHFPPVKIVSFNLCEVQKREEIATVVEDVISIRDRQNIRTTTLLERKQSRVHFADRFRKPSVVIK